MVINSDHHFLVTEANVCRGRKFEELMFKYIHKIYKDLLLILWKHFIFQDLKILDQVTSGIFYH